MTTKQVVHIADFAVEEHSERNPLASPYELVGARTLLVVPYASRTTS